jgi:hypothetical protein
LRLVGSRQRGAGNGFAFRGGIEQIGERII